MFGQFDPSMVQALAQEMLKRMKGKGMAEASSEHMPSFAHFAGMTSMTSSGCHSDMCCVVSNSLYGS